jgi:glycosyltransferase involved in cell wall biosynthesis
MSYFVSVVIPAYNEEDTIERCVSSCFNQTVQPHEVIVVDNMSTDRTKEIVTNYKEKHNLSNLILLEQNEIQGRSQTRDVGFNAATGTILGRIDADSMLSRTWVEEVIKCFNRTKADALTGPVTYYDMPIRRVALVGDNFSRKVANRIVGKQKLLFGANMALTTDCWHIIKDKIHDDVGDLYHEDIDMAIHIVIEEQKIEYAPKVVALISARRITDNLRDYHDYIKRFTRTYELHDINSKKLKFPEFLLMGVYFFIHPLSKVYKRKYNTDKSYRDQFITYSRKQRKQFFN